MKVITLEPSDPSTGAEQVSVHKVLGGNSMDSVGHIGAVSFLMNGTCTLGLPES